MLLIIALQKYIELRTRQRLRGGWCVRDDLPLRGRDIEHKPRRIAWIASPTVTTWLEFDSYVLMDYYILK